MEKMKKIWVALLLAGIFFGTSSCMKEDIDEIREELQKQDERLAALEQWQQSVNTDIQSLQSLIEALEGKDYVTGVTPLPDGTGYVISFQKSGNVTIKHGEQGEKGEDGTTPVISVKQDTDGKYYWTVNGEWLLDGDDKMPVTGDKGDTGTDAIAPQIRINSDTNEWEVSTDGGTTWASTGIQATGEKGDSFFESVTVSEQAGYVEVKIQGKDTFRIPLFKNRLTFALNGMALADLAQIIDISQGALTYAVVGNGSVSARILEGSGWSAEIVDSKVQITGKVGESALLELTLTENGKVIEIYRLKLTQSTFNGKGTSDEPYVVSSAEELSYLAKQVNNGITYADKHFQLDGDIDLSGIEMEPIGIVRVGAVAKGKAFQGTFDGGSHVISNLKMSTEDTKLAQGLFGYNKGVIRNLILEDVTVEGSESQGALAGDNRGTIENCHVRGTVAVEGTNHIGGLVGTNYGDNSVPAVVTDCSVSGNVTVKGTGVRTGIGGVIGFNATGKVTACRFYGKLAIDGSDYCSMGGVVGHNSTVMKVDESAITACYANCTLESTPIYTGGVAGTNNDSGANRVTACYSVVASSNKNIGGVCGATEADLNACFWQKSGTGFYPQHGIDNSFDNYYNPDKISDANATQVSGDSWSEAMAAMNAALSGQGWQYRLNDGPDRAIFPLIIEPEQ